MKKHLIITVIIASCNLAISQSNCFQKGMLYNSFENYLAKKSIVNLKSLITTGASQKSYKE